MIWYSTVDGHGVNMKFDTYSLYARVPPVLLALVPLVVLRLFYVNEEFLSFTQSLGQLELGLTVSMSIVLIVLLVELNRLISKGVFESIYFQGIRNLPTTRILLHQDDRLSKPFKRLIHSRIQ